jgi:hypothetical protein
MKVAKDVNFVGATIYWIDLVVHHNIDAMHFKANVCKSLLGTLMNKKNKTKDQEKARVDMDDLDIYKA